MRVYLTTPFSAPSVTNEHTSKTNVRLVFPIVTGLYDRKPLRNPLNETPKLLCCPCFNYHVKIIDSSIYTNIFIFRIILFFINCCMTLNSTAIYFHSCLINSPQQLTSIFLFLKHNIEKKLLKEWRRKWKFYLSCSNSMNSNNKWKNRNEFACRKSFFIKLFSWL